MKRCSACHECLPLEAFSTDVRASDGRQSRCRACARRIYAERREHYTTMARRHQHGRRRGLARPRSETLLTADRQRTKAAKHERYTARRDVVLAQVARYQREHPERVRLYRQVRSANAKARALGCAGALTTRDVEHLPLECVYCGATEQLSIDHATPLTHGGANDWSNVTTACLACNGRKGARTAPEFLGLEGAAA